MGETLPTHEHDHGHGHDHGPGHHHHHHGDQSLIKSKLLLLLGLAVAAVLLCYMFMFQVGQNETALLTTFGKVDDDSIIEDSGLNFRLPWPFQQVVKYSDRLQLTEAPLTQMQTDDGYSVVIRTYITWRVKDPLKFYNAVRDMDNADEKLVPLIRAANATFSNYRFNQIVNTAPAELKLDEIEAEALAKLQADLKAIDLQGGKGYGIEVTHFGIRRKVLPQQVTAKVFERMKSDRQRRAAFIRSQGKAAASAIEKEAEAKRDSILAFADRHAEEIRTKGRKEAAKVYTVFETDEEFAIFLAELEAIKTMMKNKMTILLDVNQLAPGHPLRRFLPNAGKNPTPGATSGE